MKDYIGYAYAFTIGLGGVFGFLKAGSTSSLVAGLTFGSLAAYGAHRVSNNSKNVGLALIVSVLLLVVMSSRFYKSGKVMPSGVVAILR
ncbi:7715_t:CDS:2 [Acaulospora morrowiae]|uniref:7715_t:CDS:1 n=1 Tax=Acaulospora morrowiae TaxID=94023 RepID=A0A9N9BCS1_9GLOM|nr:7715_t:CDS:2 [Acaulospora morrowiae]